MNTSPPTHVPMQYKRKLELLMTREEAASFLAALAKGLDTGTLAVGQSGLELSGFKSLTVSLKNHPQGLYLKLKCKFPKPAESAACSVLQEDGSLPPECPVACPTGHGKYGSLKKRMKGQFKSIMETLALGSLPSLELARAFAADGERMCSYPGKGDEYYPAYLEKNAMFLQAVEAGDVIAAQALAGELEQLKKDCHDRYK